MNRFLALLKTDVVIQFRNYLYAIGIGVAVIFAIVLSQLVEPSQFFLVVPTLMLLGVGGSTMMYVAGMILFEKDENTLNAVIVSPLRVVEYLWSKIISLSILAMIEGLVMISGAMLILSWHVPVSLPRIIPLLLGIMAIGIVYCLVGIVLVVRYDKITDFILPMGAIAGVLQLPFLYFFEIFQHPFLLFIPTSAPTMIVRGAYVSLSWWQWGYAIGYTLCVIVVLGVWAKRAFIKYITMRAG